LEEGFENNQAKEETVGMKRSIDMKVLEETIKRKKEEN
jgi:hypothetical protein